MVVMWSNSNSYDHHCNTVFLYQHGQKLEFAGLTLYCSNLSTRLIVSREDWRLLDISNDVFYSSNSYYSQSHFNMVFKKYRHCSNLKFLGFVNAVYYCNNPSTRWLKTVKSFQFYKWRLCILAILILIMLTLYSKGIDPCLNLDFF